MVKIKHVCDICKTETDNTVRLPVTVLVNKDDNVAASVSELDICNECLFKVFPVTFANGQYCYNPVVEKPIQKYEYEEVKND